MITPDQKTHFNTFGFISLKQAVPTETFIEVAKDVDYMLEKNRDGRPFGTEAQSISPFVGQSVTLTNLVNDSIAEVVTDLIGPDFIWAGSEGHATLNSTHGWHADRTSEVPEELAYTRLKINMYLDPITAENGALRVLPGSHQPEFHKILEPLETIHLKAGNSDPTATPYGVLGPDMPFVAFDSMPGDLICFNQSLFHSVFNSFAGRRYVAFKFAAKPTTETHYKVIAETVDLSPDLNPEIDRVPLPWVREICKRTAAVRTRITP